MCTRVGYADYSHVGNVSVYSSLAGNALYGGMLAVSLSGIIWLTPFVFLVGYFVLRVNQKSRDDVGGSISRHRHKCCAGILVLCLLHGCSVAPTLAMCVAVAALCLCGVIGIAFTLVEFVVYKIVWPCKDAMQYFLASVYVVVVYLVMHVFRTRHLEGVECANDSRADALTRYRALPFAGGSGQLADLGGTHTCSRGRSTSTSDGWESQGDAAKVATAAVDDARLAPSATAAFASLGGGKPGCQRSP